jgi:PAS domain-containing protein
MGRWIQIIAVAIGLTSTTLDSAEQQSAAREVAPAELASSQLTAGEEVRVTGKYQERIDSNLLLVDCGVEFVLKRPELFKQILHFKAQHDNMTLTGTVVEQNAGFGIEVTELTRAPSDAEVFSKTAQEMLTREHDDEEIINLQKRMLTMYGRFKDEDLIPLVQQVFKDALEARSSPPSGEKVEPWLSLVRALHEFRADEELALELTLHLQRHDTGNHAIIEFLTGLNCRRYNGAWVTLSGLKQKEGLVKSGKRWITPREQHLLESLESYLKQRKTNLIPRKRTEREYQLLAEHGKVQEGMRPEEVYVALGFADRVERRVIGKTEFCQWTYGDSYYYFFDGTLVATPEK